MGSAEEDPDTRAGGRPVPLISFKIERGASTRSFKDTGAIGEMDNASLSVVCASLPNTD